MGTDCTRNRNYRRPVPSRHIPDVRMGRAERTPTHHRHCNQMNENPVIPEKRGKIFYIRYAALAKLLGIEDAADFRIVDKADYSDANNNLSIKVWHPSFDPVMPGETYPVEYIDVDDVP